MLNSLLKIRLKIRRKLGGVEKSEFVAAEARKAWKVCLFVIFRVESQN